MKKSQKGFTLVELIVVIAIIGVLAAILVPAMVGYIKDSKFTSANANAKQIYNSISAFSQKCETAGKRICVSEITTGVLTIGDAGDEAKAGSVVTAEGGATALNDSTVAEIQKAVNSTLGADAKGSVYKVTFNASGFPKATFWAKANTDTVVGIYPAPVDNEETSGGISAASISASAAD